MIEIVKAHAYGNDFLCVRESDLQGRDPAALARASCHRHVGIGADGLILYRFTSEGAAMRLFNADGSAAEVSGNGVRCLAVLAFEWHRRESGAERDVLVIETDAGPKRLVRVESAGRRHTFRAHMGQPSDLRLLDLDCAGETVRVVALRVGNPQCVVIGAPLTDSRLRRLGPALEHHEAFAGGTNVELARVETPADLRILIWERGVGPTQASGTGACAAAVACAAFGGADRVVTVTSPGGSQRVEWLDEGLVLTGWAEIILTGQWHE